MEGLKLAETLGFNATAKAETLAIEALQNLYHMARAYVRKFNLETFAA
jgi:hypothetical protein